MNFMGLSLAANTMLINSRSLEIIGQNISNANTPGYSRQEAVTELSPFGYNLGYPSNGSYSLGSQLSSIERYRSDIFDGAYRNENSNYGSLESKSDYLEQIAEIFSEDSDYSLATTLNGFWSSWNDAANNPEDKALREMVISQADILTLSINQKSNKLSDLTDRIDQDIRSTVDEINSIIDDLAKINYDVVRSVPESFETNVLLDKKDQLLDQLSGYANIQVVNDVKNSVTVYLDGAVLISEREAFKLSIKEDLDGTFHIMSASNSELNVKGGKLGGYMDVKSNYLTQSKAELDQWTQTFINEVNNIHKFGYGLDGSTGLDFFSGTKAGDIKVNISNSNELALAVPRLTSSGNINTSGNIVSLALTLQSQTASFGIAPDAAGEVNINGVAVAWDGTQTLNQILDNISTAVGITWKFDSLSQKLSFSAPANSSDIVVTDTTGNFSQFMKLDTATLVKGSPGDGENAIKMFELSEKKVFGNETINSKYQTNISTIGYETSFTKTSMTTQKTYLDSLVEKRDSVSGVSVDEEVVSLMKYQRAFQAGARLATVIDEMLQTMVNMA